MSSSGTPDTERRWRRWEVYAAVIAAVAAIGGLGFLGYQSRESVKALNASKHTGQVQYNLQIMERTDDTLLAISRDKSCAAYVWGRTLAVRPKEGSTVMECGDSLIDELSMAMKAVYCLPGFSSNGEDWSDYVTFQLKNGPNLVRRIRDKPTWWPEVASFAGLPKTKTDCG
jgi:hypothetical protein